MTNSRLLHSSQYHNSITLVQTLVISSENRLGGTLVSLRTFIIHPEIYDHFHPNQVPSLHLEKKAVRIRKVGERQPLDFLSAILVFGIRDSPLALGVVLEEPKKEDRRQCSCFHNRSRSIRHGSHQRQREESGLASILFGW